MALVWKVIIIDATSGVERMQDMTELPGSDPFHPWGGVDMQRSSFQPTTSSKSAESKLVLSFPMATPDLKITEMMEVWAGWQDDVTGNWASNPPPYGGYIIRIDRETTYGGEKTFECTLVDYNILLRRTDVIGWPTFLRNLPANQAAVGYPPGYTVRDWLIGSTAENKPYDGVVRAHLGNGVLFDGVDSIFEGIVFTNVDMPGIIVAIPALGAVQGYFGGGGTTVDSVVKTIGDQAIVNYWANYAGPELVVGYWMSAAADGDRIVPRFNFKNVADTVAAYDYVIAADADPLLGEISMLHPHKHERDASDIRTVINIFGLGGDETDPTHRLTFGSYIHPDHSQVYPTKYQISPGWGGGPIYEPRLHRITTAEHLAEIVENRVWGAKGSIEFYVDQPILAGQRVRVRDPNEVLDRVYVVVESEGPDENNHWRLRVGFTQPTVADVINGGMADVLLVREDLDWKRSKDGSRLLPGQGQLNPVDTKPTSSAQNHVTAGYNDTVGMRVQATTLDRDYGNPIPDNEKANSFEVMPPSTEDNLEPAAGTWTSNMDGRPHPQVYTMGFTAAGSTTRILVPWDTSIDRIKVKGTGSATINKNGVAAAGPFSPASGWQNVTPPVTYSEADDDDWSVTVSGVSGNLSVAISEP